MIKQLLSRGAKLTNGHLVNFSAPRVVWCRDVTRPVFIVIHLLARENSGDGLRERVSDSVHIVVVVRMEDNEEAKVLAPDQDADEWFMFDGMAIMLGVQLIVTRQYRGLHTHKVDEMVTSIIAGGYIKTSIIVTQLVDGVHYLVDGLHRLTAVFECIRRGKLPSGFQVKTVVLKGDTPDWYVVAYSAQVNENNKNSMLMTFTDKLRWFAYYLGSLVASFTQQQRRGATTTTTTWHDVTPQFATNRMKVKTQSHIYLYICI